TFDAVVCANADLSARLRAGGVDNVRTVPMGVESGVFSPEHRSPAVRTALLGQCGLGPDATLLVAAGRLAPEKRLPMLVEAATAAGRHSPIGLVIIGEGRERHAVVRAIGGNPHIRVLKPERDRARFATLLASADALLHGCESETFCMIAAEARASGLPVIVPDSGGAAEFARGSGGIAYRSADREDAARAVAEFASGGFAPTAGVNSRTMHDHFTELFTSYRELLTTRRSLAA
ncbi:MAG: glycosyltransferase, partial [Tsuneonella sp.]